MKALVVGAGGFVGPYLANDLMSHGYEVLLTKLPSEEGFSPRLFVDLDLADRESIDRLLASYRPDAIFHLAALSSVKESWDHPIKTMDVNLIGTMSLLESARLNAPQASILLVGSGEEYGPVDSRDLPIRETHPCHPGNFYALSKCAQNSAGQIYASAYHMKVVMTRSFNHIGVGQSTKFAIPDFCSQAVVLEGVGGGTIRVGNLDVERDFTDVRDIVRAYRLLSQKGISGETYNVGTGKGYVLEDLLRLITRHAKCPIKVVVDPERLRPTDVKSVYPDVSKLQRDTGWKPEVNIDMTIREIMDYYRRK